MSYDDTAIIRKSLAAAKINFVTVPGDVMRLGQKFRIGIHSVVLAFHVGQT